MGIGGGPINGGGTKTEEEWDGRRCPCRRRDDSAFVVMVVSACGLLLKGSHCLQNVDSDMRETKEIA